VPPGRLCWGHVFGELHALALAHLPPVPPSAVDWPGLCGVLDAVRASRRLAGCLREDGPRLKSLALLAALAWRIAAGSRRRVDVPFAAAFLTKRPESGRRLADASSCADAAVATWRAACLGVWRICRRSPAASTSVSAAVFDDVGACRLCRCLRADCRWCPSLALLASLAVPFAAGEYPRRSRLRSRRRASLCQTSGAWQCRPVQTPLCQSVAMLHALALAPVPQVPPPQVDVGPRRAFLDDVRAVGACVHLCRRRLLQSLAILPCLALRLCRSTSRRRDGPSRRRFDDVRACRAGRCLLCRRRWCNRLRCCTPWRWAFAPQVPAAAVTFVFGGVLTFRAMSGAWADVLTVQTPLVQSVGRSCHALALATLTACAAASSRRRFRLRS